MDKDEIKGKMKDIAGRAERQAGEWTDNEKAQREGAAKQAEGKLQQKWGKVKDTARDISEDLKEGSKDAERDIDRKKSA